MRSRSEEDRSKKAYREEIAHIQRDASRLKQRPLEIEQKITRLMTLYERGNISPEIIESRIKGLEREKAEIEDIFKGERQACSTIEYAEAELNDTTIKNYVNRFEELLNESNMHLMRDFIKTFVATIELWGREEGKRRGRKVHIHGQIPALTMIGMVSPRGLEPLLQDRKS